MRNESRRHKQLGINIEIGYFNSAVPISRDGELNPSLLVRRSGTRRRIKFLLLFLFSWAGLEAQHLARNSFEVAAGIGRRGIINQQKGVLRGTGSLFYNIRIHSLWDLKIGADAIYYDRTDQNLLLATSYEKWAYGALIGSDFKMNRIIFTNGVGRYLYFNSRYPIRYYTRIGFKYAISKHLNAGFFMRAHRYQADYIDFGISLKI